MGTMPDDLRMELSAPMVLYARAEAAEANWAALKEYLDQRITMDEQHSGFIANDDHCGAAEYDGPLMAYRNVRAEMWKLERG